MSFDEVGRHRSEGVKILLASQNFECDQRVNACSHQPKKPFSRVHFSFALPNLSSMPPKSKPKLTLAEKHKMGLPNKSAKRSKIDDSVTPEKSAGRHHVWSPEKQYHQSGYEVSTIT
jgi:hypothetical protein